MSTLKASGFAQISPDTGLVRNDTTAKFEVGTVISDTLGNSYRYVKANEALVVGKTVTAVAKAAWDTNRAVDGAITANTTNVLHIDTITTAMTINQYAGYYVSQATAAGKGIGYRIAHHDAMAASGEGDLYLEDEMKEAFTDDTALLIYNPYVVELVDAATELIMGVCIGTIASGSYGFIQVGGHCPAVLVGHTTSAAIILNEPLATIAGVPGACQGMAGSDEADIMESAASPLIALQAVDADTTGYVEAFIKGLV